MVATFWIFGNFLATFWHSSEQLSSILRAQSGQAYTLNQHGNFPLAIKRKDQTFLTVSIFCRLLAVPFWIVENEREKAETWGAFRLAKMFGWKFRKEFGMENGKERLFASRAKSLVFISGIAI